ncbi:hypothetical protein BDV27DRAFT_119230 [Aspergillus caelatus]|uniref:Uncharacterized protein n=1 Tax=Aspergillus caelatus TaxID=61420 RepID=A0A5N7AMP1_9EURO|nr:uncharacterized protein BDV27DRAFT_119230 [Aspergillus caelatus]KAE8370973.1 hypothetical protein BDV27DRAFT_119230 [Aspergillus caelatus]
MPYSRSYIVCNWPSYGMLCFHIMIILEIQPLSLYGGHLEINRDFKSTNTMHQPPLELPTLHLL